LLRCITASLFAAAPLLPVAAGATGATAFLAGTVSVQGAPAPGATVIASGNNVTVRAVTDNRGRFTFPPLPLGSYVVDAQKNDLRARLRLDLGNDGANVSLSLERLRQIGEVAVSRSLPMRGSGSDVTLNGTDLTRLPYNNSFPEMLIQLPGAVRGANGVVHINGDHGVINYQINGVALPQGLNRDIGSEINLNDLSYVDVIEGAYPPQYGLKFGSILNLTTKSGTGPPGFDDTSTMGSYATLQSTLDFHSPLAGGGGYSLSVGGMHTTRGLDPPDFDSPHNNASNANQYMDVAIPAGGNDFTNLTFVHSYGTYQIPNAVNFGEPANTDDNETQEDTFFSLQFRHSMGDAGGITFGPALKVSRIRDFGDPANDFIYGEAVNVTPPPFGNGGSPTDCADALHSGNFTPTTCAYSLTDSRTAIDYIMQADYSAQLGRHEIRAGAAYDLARIAKDYAITLQPENFLAPIVTPKAPDAPITVVDDAPNVGNTYQSYLQDRWRIDDRWEADYGVRYDFFTIRSMEFAQGFGAFSPRLKLTRSFGKRANVYAYVGRFFEPFSLENVSPKAAQLLNLPLQPTPAQFDLKPERDTQLELGGHVPLGAGQLGLRVWQKNANDLIDDTQVGVTLLHQDINYVLGRLSQEALDYVLPLRRNGRAYVSIAHTVSLNKGCETQLLAPCFGSPTDFTPADHNQAYSAAGGILLNDARGGWFSADAEYGSGLSSAICPPGTPGYCEVTPHTIVSVGKGIAIGPHVALTLSIQNLFNDRYYVTLLNAQGNHYAPPRTLTVGVQVSRP
ncbi:MAG: TonB-dependent receptor, partial [Candidatus Eremiobacteraeota bacterium]|nr:TonB-dependent receptor [Candidatus Eremiobacteraeota bacterium]